MLQPSEITNFQEYESLLNDLKELAKKQGEQIKEQRKQIKKLEKFHRRDSTEARLDSMECQILSLKADKKIMQLQVSQVEKENKAQKSKISKLESNILDIEDNQLRKAFNRIDDNMEAIQDIGAKLLNQTTQKGAWRKFESMFYKDGCFDALDEQKKMEWSTNTSKWGESFTTPQGDDNERRIARIEEKLRMFSGEFIDLVVK